MSPVRTVYVPWLGPSQGDEPQPDQTEPPSQGQRGKRGSKRADVRGERARSILKVILPKFNKKATKKEKTPRRWMLEPAANKAKTSDDTDAEFVGGDVFIFSQRPTGKAAKEKEKAKLVVLRTISKVLEENQLTRQRLASLRQAN